MKKSKGHILIIEDSRIDQMTFKRYVTQTKFSYHYDLAESVEEASRLLQNNRYDIIITDYMLGDGTAFDLIDKMNDTPFIVVTGAGNEEIAVQAMKLGASDYLIKGPKGHHLKTLELTVDKAIKQNQSEKELDNYRKNLKKMIQDRTAELQTEIAEREKAQQQLEKTTHELEHYIKELELYLHIASHDLQEPLHTISNYVQLLEKRYRNKLDKDANEMIDYTVEGVKQLQSIIDDLILYSTLNKESRSISSVNCNTLIKTILSEFTQKIDKDKAHIIVDDLPKIKADKKQLTLLFHNLIDNAIKFKSEEKNLTIQISVTSHSGEWIFAVKDNGIGIPSQYHDRIFIIFQRLHTRKKYPGNGIGLTICKRIVEHHNGTIWVESKFQKGSTFYFTLPKAES